MPRLFDVFMFRDELDMLECRLRELEKWDLTHILVESPVTHRGDPKPLAYAVSQERYARWADRIIHVVAGDLPGTADPWVREHAQRDAALPYLKDAANDDVVLISDVDEFPPREFRVAGPAVSFSQRLCMYAVDWEYPERHVCTVAAKASFVRHLGLANVRDGRYSFPSIEGGWHLTWLGGEEGQRAKLGVHCHLEMRQDEYDRIWSGACYERGEHHSGSLQMVPVDVDETWPRYIYERRCPKNWFRPR